MRTVIGISGASGTIYGLRLLENLPGEKHLIVSEGARFILKKETECSLKHLNRMADYHYDNSDIAARISSGSYGFDAMAVVPCSLSTLSKIATGISDNLITRVASVCLKERRKLVLVPRETPLSTIHLKNMHELSVAGAIILPAMPAFYGSPKSVDDMVNFVVGRILDVLGVENSLYERWK